VTWFVHIASLLRPHIDINTRSQYQAPVLYCVNGLLSMVSDNVFVATIFIKEVEKSYLEGRFSTEHFESLGVAVNAGTNIPSMATPNGQAAFLFLLTSSIAPLVIRNTRKGEGGKDG
jgi:NhaB family Na+:H+ antiporter